MGPWTLLWLVSCIKPPPPQAAPEPVPVRLTVVLESFDSAQVGEAPEAFDERLVEELTRRNLVPQRQPVDASFARIRSTEGRLERMVGEGPELLVECAPRFSAQVNGRYRWNVEISATLHDPASDGVQRTFQVPVHLVYDHQEGPDALIEAMPIVARRLGTLLDEWIDITLAPAR